MKVDWGCTCGRTCLLVNGYIVAAEGDVCRDIDLGVKFPDSRLDKGFGGHYFWTADMIKFVAEGEGDIRQR